MIRKLITVFLCLTLPIYLLAQDKILQAGMTIRKSMKIKKGVYDLRGSDSMNGKAVIIIEGNNLVVDFNQAQLKGNSNYRTPDQFSGIAIHIKKGKNITIKNLSARGYKIALLATGIDGLKIVNCDFSYNYRQRLNSTQEKEDISDWLSFHKNDQDEWMRYGAAIYLKNCNRAIVSDCKVTGGQNALMMTGCNLGKIYNNDFSFNSGVGIGLYRSSNNEIKHNRINFNVRGYSHGVYSRGQDSAGILVYEQSNWNLFYKNSVTHGGDGFFLWAGQTTMDKGTGGCNDNQILYNDFSYAPTNGIEVTFSRNQISHNRIFECNNGIWGGYSYETAIISNQFRNNKTAIAIEHGQHNQINNNIFYRDASAIKLWSRKSQPSDWGYAKYHDVRNADYEIALNSFNNLPIVFDLTSLDSIRIFGNNFSNCEMIYKMDSTVRNIDTSERVIYDTTAVDYNLKNAKDPFKGNAKFAGRKNIMITEWGPYDFQYPIIWHTNTGDTSDLLEFNVLGPKGNWKIISSSGIHDVVVSSDSLPAKISCRKNASADPNFSIQAEFTGMAFTDQWGQKIPARKKHSFGLTKFFQPVNFQIKWFDLDSTVKSIHNLNTNTITKQEPFKIETVQRLDFTWWDGIRDGGNRHPRFFTVAEGDTEIKPGMYEISLTWDDAAKLFLDGKLLIDEWIPAHHPYDEAPNKKIKIRLGGKHRFRIEQAALDGFACLIFKINRLNP